MGSISLTHILVFIVIVLIVMRPNKVLELSKAFKKAIRNFNEARNEIDAEYKEVSDSKDVKDEKKNT
jgi:Sec-independent protein translocase protein TatA